MGISEKAALRRIDRLCLEAKHETDPAKIAGHLREIIRELNQLLDAFDENLRLASENDNSVPKPKRWVS